MEVDIIYNDDCYKKIKEIPDNSIDCIYIDIPYLFEDGGTSQTDMEMRRKKIFDQLQRFDLDLINNEDNQKHNLKRIDKYNAQKRLDTCSMTDGINYSILDDLVRVMKKINIFIWCSKLQIPYILNYFLDKGCYYDILVWAKTNAIPTNNCFLSDLEYCLYFRSEGVIFNDGYYLKSKWYCSCVNKKDKKRLLHPTIKPFELVKNHLMLATKPSDIVLDCFAGSGVTAVVCKDIQRHYVLIEREECFYNISVDRVENKVDALGQYSMFPI